MAQQPDVQAILAALQASQNNAGTPTQQYQQPPPGMPQPYQQQPPQAYGLPQPTASGSVDLSAIRPVSTGNVNFQDALSKARNFAADKGISYDPRQANNGPPRQDPRLAGRPPQQQAYHSERSRTPPRRDDFRNNNPYRDERRDDSRRNNGYNRERSRSPPRGGARGGTFSPLQQRDRAAYQSGGSGGQRDDDNQETIMVESSLVGLVIGRQGENLRRIESESGTRIQFITGPTESGPQRQCRITGPPRARMDAKKEVYRIIDENGGNAPKDFGPPGGARGGSSNGGSQAGARGVRSTSNQPQLREGENSIQIMVPDRTVGLIIGRGGETIRDLQERSGCHINIVGENKSINGLRPVNLIGNQQAASKAKELILEIVESDTRSQEAGGAAAASAPAGRPQQQDRRQQHDSMDGKVTETLMVPSDSVGMIIGKGGETIKSMQAETGCKINVQQASGRDVERPIDLVGSAQAIEAAKQAIWEKVNQVKDKNNGGGGGRGGNRDDRHDRNDQYGGGAQYSQQQAQSWGQQPAQGMPPQVGAPAAQAGGEDPYAQYGGYQNYVMLWMAAAQQQGLGGQGQAPGGPPGA
ncbi:Serine/threonine-protein kinase [Venturia nashicola]|uniref:Serine/threonine-protein kinase n=1 Tax=Venturia nashicola TaxID=86259 RepID=A0A4Z1NET0_9PEZI|nr:Serine/threonine-protein kinase [Venturia nashicola]